MRPLFAKTWLFGTIAVIGFVALLSLEFAGKGHWPTPQELVLETLELVLLLATVVGLAVLALRVSLQQAERTALQRALAEAQLDGDEARHQMQRHLEGLASAIRREFRRWRFTEAEAEVAWLVVKGLSHKEIAALRGTSVATVRQQAGVAYEKAGIKGRAAFCAYFLEDLLPAVETAPDIASVERAHAASLN